MSVIKSAMFVGSQPVDTPAPDRSGDTITQIITHTFTTALTTADILELYPVPAECRIVGFEFVTANVGTLDLDIGMMTGEAGSSTAGRTCGDELIAAVDAATGGSTGLAALAALQDGVGDKNASIGLVTATNIAAGATKTITFKVTIAG